MEIRYHKLVYYPFSGLNSSDFLEIINLFKQTDEKLELTIIYADTLDFNSNNEVKNFAAFFNELGRDRYKLTDSSNTSFNHSIEPAKIEDFKKVSKKNDPNYGWSENSQIQSFNFSFQKNDIFLDFIYLKNDAFNCLDFLSKNSLGELNIVFKNPGAHLNSEGLIIFNDLFSNVELLNEIYIHTNNDMKIPNSFEFINQINNYKHYHNKRFNKEIADRLKNVLNKLSLI